MGEVSLAGRLLQSVLLDRCSLLTPTGTDAIAAVAVAAVVVVGINACTHG